MSGHLPFIVGFGVFGGAVLILVAIALRVERRSFARLLDRSGVENDPATGDPMNPEAITQWRKAKWKVEQF